MSHDGRQGERTAEPNGSEAGPGEKRARLQKCLRQTLKEVRREANALSTVLRQRSRPTAPAAPTRRAPTPVTLGEPLDSYRREVVPHCSKDEGAYRETVRETFERHVGPGANAIQVGAAQWKGDVRARTTSTPAPDPEVFPEPVGVPVVSRGRLLIGYLPQSGAPAVERTESPRVCRRLRIGKLGCAEETLRQWVRRAERDAGRRPGLATDEGARLQALEREHRELRRANAILCKASAYFAQGRAPGPELDRRAARWSG